MSGFVSLPDTFAECRDVAGHGARPIRLYRWRSSGGASRPALLWGHANGFAAGSYRTLFAALAADLDIFAFDAAGQGGSAQPAPGEDLEAFCDPDALAADVEAVAREAAAWAGRPLVYAAHSMCGAAMLRLALFHPARFASLGLKGMMLFEPPFFPPAGHPLHDAGLARHRKRVTRASARRDEFPGGPDELAAYITGREIFARFRPDQIAAHAAATLRADAGTWRLACPPAVETAVFRALGGRPVNFPALDRFPASIPLHFVAGDIAAGLAQGVTVTAMMPDAAAKVPHAKLTELAGASHMMVFEEEGACAGLLKSFAAACESR
jgi:pimeloyl-ACP methyl ester carboxylesterase